MRIQLVTSAWRFQEALPLLLLAFGRLSALPEWQRRYLTDDTTQLWTLNEGNQLVGIVGMHQTTPQVGELTHIAVNPEHRLRGLGRWLVEGLQRQHPSIARWWCETDDDAVAFYRRLGWTATPVRSPHPGWRPRYRCEGESN